MAEKPYVAGVHYITKALADVDYPISKNDLIGRVGATEIQMDWNEKKTMKELLDPVELDKFENAASLFNALAATLY